MSKEGGWVFISHSHWDVNLVRPIRNYLEQLGLEPLMFYLKCLSDKNEIEDLIKREIDERDWFIYADSPNARKSNWVKTEREYIEQFEDKTVFTIDLSDDIETQLKQLEHISRQMKVFISYAWVDRELQGKIKAKLIEKDMLVLDGNEEEGEADKREAISVEEQFGKVLKKTLRNGFCIVLITEAAAKSRWTKYEVEKIVEAGGKIIPVFVGDVKLPEDLVEHLGDIPGVRIDKDPTEEQLDLIINKILSEVEFFDFDFKSSTGYQSAKTIHLPLISRIDRRTFAECTHLECVYIPDSVIYISPDAFDAHPDILVRCTPNSYAEQYCKRNGIKYELC